MIPVAAHDDDRPSGVYPCDGRTEDTIALLRALYGLAFDALHMRRALACSVLIRELADEVAAGAPASIERLVRLRSMTDDAAAQAVRIIEEGTRGAACNR